MNDRPSAARAARAEWLAGAALLLVRWVALAAALQAIVAVLGWRWWRDIPDLPFGHSLLLAALLHGVGILTTCRE